ncbi:SDR family NAD(P)-dependent oxidoreductase [Dactylosporangium sp. CA-139066]|uniref:SDR family NAD(P)-dependent oxidoreductase n=1 Tax=Dactylosporangium sp. CA-139066 TaxID=3239930 RepID=UPI003D8C83A2
MRALTAPEIQLWLHPRLQPGADARGDGRGTRCRHEAINAPVGREQPARQRRGAGGAIVVTSSMAGIAPAPFDPVYSATKHALIGLVRSVALAVAGTGVTVDAVCPGLTDTPLLDGLRPEAERLGLAIADPDLVAEAVETLAGDGETGRA